LKGHGELERYDKLVRLNVAMTSALGLGVTLTLASLGDLVLGLFGKAFRENASLLWPFLLGSACETATVSLYQPVQAHARIWPSFFGITLPREAIYVLSTYGFAPVYGVWGTAWSYFAACCYSLAGTAILAWWIGRASGRLAGGTS
jgi:hypothetical protein